MQLGRDRVNVYVPCELGVEVDPKIFQRRPDLNVRTPSCEAQKQWCGIFRKDDRFGFVRLKGQLSCFAPLMGEF
jgi:hypothetical protein